MDTSYDVALLIAGVGLLTLGLVGKIKVKELEVGTQHRAVRLITSLLGVIFIVLSLILVGLIKGDRAGGTSDEVASTVPDSSVSNHQSTFKTRGYIFELQKCIKDAQNVVCNIWVTNTSESRLIDFHASHPSHPSKLYDYYNNEYWATSIQLDDVASSSYIDNHLLHSDVRKDLSITFTHFHPTADRVKYLVIGAEDESAGGAVFTAILSNIELSK